MSEGQKIEFNVVEQDLSVIVRCIEQHEPITGPELAKILRHWGNDPLPRRLQEYLLDFLEGKVKRKRGRKPELRLGLLEQPEFQRRFYKHYLQWAQKRKKKYGHFAGLGRNDWTSMCYDMPANEVAARLAARRLGLGDDAWRTLQNISSSQK